MQQLLIPETNQNKRGDHNGCVAPMTSLWFVRLLGGLRAENGPLTLSRFRSQKFGALLAYLLLFPRRVHSREELADLFWPDADPEVGRANLRTALASLRRQFEPPSEEVAVPLFSLSSARQSVEINPDAVQSDVALFERALANAARAGTSPGERRQYLTEAVCLYQGPLLPGYYETWALTERDRLAEAYLRALHQLVRLHEAAGERDPALDYARRAVAADPLREETHADVIRLLMASDQSVAARRQFEEMTRLLDEGMGMEPSRAVRALLNAPASPPKITMTVPPLASAAVVAPVAMANATAAVSPPAPVMPTVRLPLAATRFFGREDETEALAELLRRDLPPLRLITVTGPGGSGKTRLTVETARRLTGSDTPFSGGIYFVALADRRAGEPIEEAVAAALGLTTSSAVPLLEQVIVALQAAPGRVLLLWDNAEHLIESVAEVVYSLLQEAENLTCLVTSRQRLLLEEEREFPLMPMPTPAHPGTPERLMEFASVQLFVSRAQAARADFRLSSRNAEAVRALCRRLEGIPLALELAAAWSQTLTPAQLLERMDRRFDLLVSRRRDLSPRHRTLRATIETSLDLLSPELRRVFTRLSVFRGGWTLEAAEAVLGTSENDRSAMPAFLEELRERSLIQSVPTLDNDDTDSDLRFRMLETLREFAAEEQQSEGTSQEESLVLRHALYFRDRARQAFSYLYGPEQGIWIRRLTGDVDNFRAALDTLSARKEASSVDAALDILGQLRRFFQAYGSIEEWRRRLEVALQRPEGSAAPARGRALYAAGLLAFAQADYSVAQMAFEECVAIWERLGQEAGVLAARSQLASIEIAHCRYAEACAILRHCVASNRAAGDSNELATNLNNLGAALVDWGKFDEAHPVLEESLRLSEQRGRLDTAACALKNLGNICQLSGDLTTARTHFERYALLEQRLGDRSGWAGALHSLGALALDESELDSSVSYLSESLAIYREMQNTEGIASVQHSRGWALLRRDDLTAAQEAFDEEVSLAHRIRNPRLLASGLEALAALAGVRSHPLRAARLWGAAESLREAAQVPLPPQEKTENTKQAAHARAISENETAFTEAWQQGRALSRDEAASFALSSAPN